MQKAVLVVVALIALFQVSLALIESRDVCIIGGGIGGMSTAVFLKDRGYTSIVLEESDTTGGACDTVRFTPPAGETVDWIDVGVQEFPNTTDANIKGRGPWTVDSVAFFARFGGGLSNVIPFGRSGRTSYNVDMKRGIQQPVVPFVPDAAWAAALGRFKAVLARYPWVDPAQVPAVVPPELLVTFDSFVETNQLEPLLPNIFNWFLWSGGLQYYNELTALYAVLNLGPTILGLTSDSTPFTLKGGCRSLYDGIEAFLGERNVLVNAKVKKVKRVTGQPHIVSGTITDPSKRSYQAFQYSCGQVFIAFAPTYDKVDDLFDLDNNERNYYTKVKMRPYFAVAVDMKGPIIDGQLFSIRNVDLNRDNDLPALPALQFLGRQENFGPVQGGATGRREISVDNMREIIQDQLDNIPSNLVTNATVVGLWRHEFQPYYTSNSLSAIPSPPAVLRSLQGYRNTWVVGSVDSFPSHVQIIERTYHLITDNFPVKV